MSTPEFLSGGEQQRVAVARALAHAPKLVIADEPTGNIDPELSLEMMELLERVSEMGITVLVVTHEHELVHRFHQRVVTLKEGRIISDVPRIKRRCWYEALDFRVPYPARRAQPGQALGHDHCLHRLPQRLHDVEHFATLVEVNVDSMVNYLGQQNEMVVYVDDPMRTTPPSSR